jgi:hypothetical protein
MNIILIVSIIVILILSWCFFGDKLNDKAIDTSKFKKTKKETILLESKDSSVYQAKELPSLWKWYFNWHPLTLIKVPIFLIFIYQGIWFIGAELQDVISFFQHPVTWGSIFLIILFGSILIWFIIGPIYICFASINWLYEINIGEDSWWKKFGKSIGIILLVIFGTSIIRLLTLWVLNI